MIDLSCKMYERNSIETIVENDGILWLNEKHFKKDQIKNFCEKLQQNIIPTIVNIDMNQTINRENNAI